MGGGLRIGIDMFATERMERLLQESSGLLNRIFTDVELIDADRSVRHLASGFAVKEAVSKLLGTGFGHHVEPDQIVVIRTSYGKPVVTLHGVALEHASAQSIGSIDVSVSHTNGTVVAVAVAADRTG